MTNTVAMNRYSLENWCFQSYVFKSKEEKEMIFCPDEVANGISDFRYVDFFSFLIKITE